MNQYNFINRKINSLLYESEYIIMQMGVYDIKC